MTVMKYEKCENNTCPICCGEFQKGQEIYQLKCTHIFCKECIDEYIKHAVFQQCPICRQLIILNVIELKEYIGYLCKKLNAEKTNDKLEPWKGVYQDKNGLEGAKIIEILEAIPKFYMPSHLQLYVDLYNKKYDLPILSIENYFVCYKGIPIGIAFLNPEMEQQPGYLERQIANVGWI